MTTEVLSEKDVAEKIKAVCKSLGWRTDPISTEFHHVYVKAQIEGLTCSYVSILYGQYPNKGRITVTARTDHDSSIYRYGESPWCITVSAIRSVDKIIAEVKRRFVPPFLEIVRKAEEIQKRRDEYQRAMLSSLVRLKHEALNEGEKLGARFTLHLEPIWGTVSYGGDDQVSLDFHGVPTETAERILAILREPTLVTQEQFHSA